MAILVIAFFVLAIALEVTGHVVFRGRLILGRGGRWLLMWCFSGVRASRYRWLPYWLPHIYLLLLMLE